jgi:perosamine synthetase
LRRIEELIAYKKWLFHEYEKGLKVIEGLKLSSSKSNVDPTYWISVAILDSKYGINKEELKRRFAEYQIDMRPLFYPVSSMPPFQPYVEGKTMSVENPVTYRFSEYGVCLPNGNNLSTDDVEYVCETFKKILKI